MTGRLPTLFADAGETCAEERQLDQAFTELARRVPPEVIQRALCHASPDRWGLCPTCGHAFDNGRNGNGHQPDGCNPFRDLLLATRAVRAVWRRFHYLRSAPPKREDQT